MSVNPKGYYIMSEGAKNNAHYEKRFCLVAIEKGYIQVLGGPGVGPR